MRAQRDGGGDQWWGSVLGKGVKTKRSEVGSPCGANLGEEAAGRNRTREGGNPQGLECPQDTGAALQRAGRGVNSNAREDHPGAGVSEAGLGVQWGH